MKHVYQIMNQPKSAQKVLTTFQDYVVQRTNNLLLLGYVAIYMSYVCTIEEILIQYLLMDTRKEQPFPQSRRV